MRTTPMHHVAPLAALLLAASCSTRPAGPSAASGIVAGPAGIELDRYLTRAAAFGMSGAVLVARHGEIILAKGYGLADTLRHTPVTERSVFYAASITKQFTAAAVLQLVQQGKLAVADSLGRLFPGVPPDKRGITVHQLLTHSSGLTSYYSPSQTAQDRAAWIQGLWATKLDFRPGTRATYSNAGFSLLAAIVEQVSGEPYTQFVRRHLFEPAGLTSTAFVSEAAHLDTTRMAFGIGGGIERDPRRFSGGWGSLGASEVMTTVLDLWKWEQALRGTGILTDSTQAVMFRPYAALAPGIDYGYGWRLQRTGRGTRVIWASGINLSYSAMYRRYVDEDVTIIFLSNAAHYGQVYRDILFPSAVHWDEGPVGRIAFGQAYSCPPWFLENPVDSLRKYAGTYHFPGHGELRVDAAGGGLRVEPRSQDVVGLFLPRPADSLMATYDSLNLQVRHALESTSAAADSEFGLGPITQEDRSYPVLREHLGRFVGVDWTVTVPMMMAGGENRATTFAAVRFERGTIPMTWRWWGSEFAGRDLGFAAGILPPFKRQFRDQFVAWYIPQAKALHIRFDLTPDGHAAQIRISGEQGETVGTRVE